MGLLSGIYDSDFMQPIVKIKENMSILSQGVWVHYIAEYIEPMPPSPASIVEMVTFSGATTLAAGAAIAKRIVTILQVNDLEFLHLRWAPLDNVEGTLWEQGGQARFNTRTVHARVAPMTREWDPKYASTTFFILGQNRDCQLEVLNPMAYATPVARFLFWGTRYVLNPISVEGKIDDFVAAHPSKTDKGARKSTILNLLRSGDRETVKEFIGPTTWVPAEGRAS